MLVSTTDTKGILTHCNAAFLQVSGFTYGELIGQPHNMIRHPDMPAEAFEDMWSTIGHGRPWTGIVKNRRKDGSYCWVEANVTPIMDGGKPRSYMSVRTKPNRQQVQDAEALYARMRSESAANRPTFALHAGVMVLWFNTHVSDVVQDAERFASDLSGCNLNTTIALSYPAPLGSLVRCLWQIRINMRAVIGDVNTEIHGFT